MWISSTADPSIHARFSAAAGSYDRHAAVQDCVAERLHEMVRNEALGPQLLEIGCGTGRLTRRLVQSFPSAHLTALDVSSAMVEQARRSVERSGEVQWRVEDFCEFEPAKRFSAVLSSSAIHWVTPFENAVRAVDRLVQPGGRIAVAMMLRESLAELHEARLRIAPHKPPQGRLPSYQELLRLSNSFDWEVIECSRQTYTTHHDSATQLLDILREQGLTGGPVSRAHAPLTRGELAALISDYEAAYASPGGGVQASYEVGFLHALKAG